MGTTHIALTWTAISSRAPDVMPLIERERLKKNGCGTVPLIGTSRESEKRVTDTPAASARHTR